MEECNSIFRVYFWRLKNSNIKAAKQKQEVQVDSKVFSLDDTEPQHGEREAAVAGRNEDLLTETGPIASC